MGILLGKITWKVAVIVKLEGLANKRTKDNGEGKQVAEIEALICRYADLQISVHFPDVLFF